MNEWMKIKGYEHNECEEITENKSAYTHTYTAECCYHNHITLYTLHYMHHVPKSRMRWGYNETTCGVCHPYTELILLFVHTIVNIVPFVYVLIIFCAFLINGFYLLSITKY